MQVYTDFQKGGDPHSGRRVVSLSKIHLPPKSTGNTQEAVAPSGHDWKIVYWDVKQKRIETIQKGGHSATFYNVDT